MRARVTGHVTKLLPVISNRKNFSVANTVYRINKHINKPIEFRGLKAQYIWWLAAGMIVLLLIFSTMYIAGLNAFICVGFALCVGGVWIAYVYRISNQYGEYGMMKKIARRKTPRVVKCRSRNLFTLNAKRLNVHLKKT